MNRLMIILIYAALTTVGAMTMYLAVESNRKDVDSRLRSGIEVSHKAYQTSARLREVELRDLAAALTGSEVGAYLSVLEDHRADMIEIEGEVYRQFPGSADDEALRADREDHVRSKTEFLDTFSTELADRIEALKGSAAAWEHKPRTQFVQDTKEALSVCNAHAVSTCFFRLTWFPLKDVVDEIRRDNPYGVRPDLVVVTDNRGTGLADADQPRWSNDTRFAERYPLMQGVRQGVILRDVLRLEGSDRYFFVAAAPVFDGGLYRGAVLVGVEIDDGLLNEESQALGWKVSYLDGTKLLRSNLSLDRQNELLINLPPRSAEPKLHTFTSDRLVAQFVPLTGNFANKDIIVALSADREEALESVNFMKQMIILYGILLFLIGTILIFGVIRMYLKPLVQIDTGIHEIINGNYDYEFPDEFSEQLWVSMAKSLNRMVGILLGRDLEEDEEELNDGWASSLMGEPNGGAGRPPREED